MKKALKNVFSKSKNGFETTGNTDQTTAVSLAVSKPEQQKNESRPVSQVEIFKSTDMDVIVHEKTLVPPPRDNLVPPDDENFDRAIKDTINPPPSEYAFNKTNYIYQRKTLGQGSYGTVKEALKKDSNTIVAIKEISKTKMRTKVDRLRNEISIMLKMSHPNVLHLLDWGLGKLTIYLVTEM